MTSEGIKWGVLSTANIGRALVNPAIQASRNGQLLAVGSRSLSRARKFAEAHGIPRSYGSYQEVLKDPEIQAVYIPLPNSLHHEWTIRAAEAGKHILCEKPLALNARQCLEMQAAADANRVKLMEAFMYRFHPRTERVIELVQSGTVGTPRIVRSSFSFRLTRPDNIRLNRELGGGSLMDVGCYCVNISRTLLGQEPEEVAAFASWSEGGVDLEMTGLLRFPDQAMAQFNCALTIERREDYEIAGAEGSLSVPVAFLPGTADTLVQENHGRGETRQHDFLGVDQYQLMVEHFADCVLLDQQPRYSAGEASRNMRVIEALYSSARKGGTVVQLDPVFPRV